jgi:bifunctional non-homologous end joining protein LigD
MKQEKREKQARIKPMLATLANQAFDDKDWIFEIKWDGYRGIASVTKGKVDLYSRNFSNFNEHYPDIVKDLAKIKEDVILDGEIIAYEKGRVGFQALQTAGHSGAKVSFMIFDILSRDGVDLRALSLMKRKEILRKLFKKYSKLKNIRESDYVEGNGKKFYDLAVKKDLEGIMAKRKDSPYVSDKRTPYWLKIKHHKSDEAVIAGFTAPRGSRKKFGAIILGQYIKKKLVFIGYTGTGFTEKILNELYAKMLPLKVKSSPFSEKIPINSPITWIKPVLVVQVKFAEWTEERIMRQPVYLGLRGDKPAGSVGREKVLNIEKNMKNKIQNKNSQFTNQDKIYFPKLKLTKGDVIEYYRKIAPYILPYLKDRPENLNRQPGGINKANFYQKNFTYSLPPFAETAKVHSESTNKEINYLVCNNMETLLYMANLGCIEINAWNSRVGKLDYPDYMIIDIDPGDNTWAELIKVAKMVKEVLDESCQKSYLKTSGKSGLHVCVPFGAKYHFDEVRQFSELVSSVVNRRLPALTSGERNPAKRRKKIYLDYLQNRLGQTTASVYSLRGTPEATVSTPLKWSELTLKNNPVNFTIFNIHARLKKVGDIWKPVIRESINLKKSIKCLQKSLKE